MAFYNDYKPYVPVAVRRQRALKEMGKLAKKGQPIAPVVIEGRAIATTFWGKAWCDNLERYQDFANRLPRGRTYVRNGSVVDLQIAAGQVRARVSGSALYQVELTIDTVAAPRWKKLVADCAGQIDSLVELLQGRVSRSVMERMCEPAAGLFPEPGQIHLECSCPDFAVMCKHVAATLYGVGARLDQRPELLFTLRAVDQRDLIASAGRGLRATARPNAAKLLAGADLSDVFGIELAPVPRPARAAKVVAKPKARATTKPKMRVKARARPVTKAGTAADTAAARKKRGSRRA
jgi:uncharacterized Zn finger protein